MDERKLYAGLDLGNEYAQLTYYTKQMEEPDTISTVAGSEIYQIPIALCKRQGIGQWYYGREALMVMEREEGYGSDHLWRRALAGEKVRIEGEKYTAAELLVLFIRKLLQLPQKLGASLELAFITVTIDTLNQDKMRLIAELMKMMDVPKEQYAVMDYQESFYYYALSQKEELWIHDAALFDYAKSNLRYYYMERNQTSTPQVVNIHQKNYGPLIGNKDTAFSDVIVDAFSRKIYSSVYLIGDGFDGDWMQQSLRYLCNGRHVFIGKNLYAKGACYASMVRTGIKEWNYVYIGENEMKVNVSLKVMDGEDLSFHTLISAGENWYEAKQECEVLLSDTKTVDFWLQLPDSREAKIESLELTDLPNRPERMTRLRIITEAVSDSEIKVLIQDLGFGDVYRRSGKTWEYRMGV